MNDPDAMRILPTPKYEDLSAVSNGMVVVKDAEWKKDSRAVPDEKLKEIVALLNRRTDFRYTDIKIYVTVLGYLQFTYQGEPVGHTILQGGLLHSKFENPEDGKRLQTLLQEYLQGAQALTVDIWPDSN